MLEYPARRRRKLLGPVPRPWWRSPDTRARGAGSGVPRRSPLAYEVQETEREEAEERGPAPELVAVFAIERVGVAPRVRGRGVRLGAAGATAMLARVGHIRVFAASAAILAASVLALHGAVAVWTWAVVRLAAGVAVAFMFAAVESWMSSSISRGERGHVMGVYMVATKAALAIGPFLAFDFSVGAAEPWMIESYAGLSR